jgi:hypothetical protein
MKMMIGDGEEDDGRSVTEGGGRGRWRRRRPRMLPASSRAGGEGAEEKMKIRSGIVDTSPPSFPLSRFQIYTSIYIHI